MAFSKKRGEYDRQDRHDLQQEDGGVLIGV